MALEGSLADFTLADMFRLLETGSKTGVLHVSAGDIDGVVCFNDGLVYYAHAGAAGEPAGKRLVKAGCDLGEAASSGAGPHEDPEA